MNAGMFHEAIVVPIAGCTSADVHMRRLDATRIFSHVRARAVVFKLI
jgi:hypothetical protein